LTSEPPSLNGHTGGDAKDYPGETTDRSLLPGAIAAIAHDWVS
jgi:hypothetical protein